MGYIPAVGVILLACDSYSVTAEDAKILLKVIGSDFSVRKTTTRKSIINDGDLQT